MRLEVGKNNLELWEAFFDSEVSEFTVFVDQWLVLRYRGIWDKPIKVEQREVFKSA